METGTQPSSGPCVQREWMELKVQQGACGETSERLPPCPWEPLAAAARSLSMGQLEGSLSPLRVDRG